MSEHVLEVQSSLKYALQSIQERLAKIDKKSNEMWDWYKENMPEETKGTTMEEKNWNDKLYLVYFNDYTTDECWLFKDSYDIQCWLDSKWSEWDLWEYSDLNSYLEESLVIWEFHRDICKEKWNHYRSSKPFIEGWSRKREYASFEFIPSFSVG